MFKRGQTYWSALFFVLLAVSAGIAVAELGSGARRGATLALAVGLALWYWHEVVRTAIPESATRARISLRSDDAQTRRWHARSGQQPTHGGDK